MEQNPVKIFRDCTCPKPIPKSGHVKECYFSKDRARARLDSRETPRDSSCPNCQSTKHPLNQLCYKCHGATNTLPRVTDGFSSKTGQKWRAKSTPTSATSGPSATVATHPLSTEPVQVAGESVSTVKTNPTSLKKCGTWKVKRNKGAHVQKGMVDSLLRVQGELDGLRAAAVYNKDKEKEVDPRPLGADDADEAAGTGEPGSPPEEQPEFQVPVGLSKPLLKQLGEDMPNVRIVSKGTDLRPMPVKRIYEKYCVSQLVLDPTQTVVVGKEPYDGCVHRHHIRSTDDVGVDSDCVCAPGAACEKCDQPTWIFVDSLAGWSARDVALILASDPSPEVYSVQYEYRAARGGLHAAPGGLPEVRWERTSDGLLVEDDQHMGKYVKDPADWTSTGACRIDGATLCWNVVFKVRECVVIRFHLVDAVLAESLEKDPLSDSFYGDTTPEDVGLGTPRVMELQAIVGPISKMYSAGDSFYCHVENQRILVPKQGVGHIALWAAGKPREQRTYADAYVQARQWLKMSKLTTLERADCVPYMVAFGLMRTLGTEARAVAVLGSHAHAIAVHNDQVIDPFAPPVPESLKRWRKWFVDNQRWLRPVLGVASLATTYVLAVFNKGKIVHTLAAVHGLWLKLRAVPTARATSPLLSLLLYVCDIVFSWFRKPVPRVAGPLQTYCARGRALKAMRPGATCRIRSTDVSPGSSDADHYECQPTQGPYHVGLGVTGFIPVIARHCIHNDLVAVRNRGICERAKPETGWWQSVGRARMFKLFANLGPITPTPRDEWLSRYPTKKRRELQQAYDSDYGSLYDATHRKAFTKTECAVKRGDVDIDDEYGIVEGYDPRLIQGCQPSYVNATGPFAHAYSKACKGEHGHTTYGPGLNAEGLDVWLQMAEDAFDEPLAYIDSDAVRLDASVDKECISVEADLYEHLGADELACAMFRADTITHGATSCGVVYRVDGTVPSGKTTTTCGNTTAVITVVEEALAELPHKAIVAGDDAAVVVPLRLVKEACLALTRMGKNAGFEFKVKASRFRYDMEFCSGRWWPAATHSGFAFGPKPGKLLPKLFFAATKNVFGSNPEGYCKAICEGMFDTVSHLPVAREFIDHVYSLVSDSKLSNSMVEKLRMQNLQNVRRKKKVAQSDDIWEAYAHIYGVSSIDCQRAIAAIREVKVLPNLVEHHVFGDMVAQDAPPVVDPLSRDPTLLADACSIKTDELVSWLTPLAEEFFRYVWPRATTVCLIVVEAVLWRRAGNSLLGYIPAAALHAYAMSLHLRGQPGKAVLVHYLYNTAVALWNGRGRLANGNLRDRTVSCLVQVGPESYQSDMQVALPQRQRQRRIRKKAQGGPPPLPARPTQREIQAAMGVVGGGRRPRRRRNRRRGNQPRYGGETIERQSLARAGGRAVQGGIGIRKTDRIVEREFVATIPGSVAYTVQKTLALNPGLVNTFTWLSIEAAGWESYRFNKLRFIYYTRKGSTTDGSVIMGPDYDPLDPAPADEAIFTTYQDVKEFAPWMDNVCVELDSQQLNKIGRSKFIRSGALPAQAQLADYDSGNFFIATEGMADASNVGKLWVEYDVTFETKQKNQSTVVPTSTRTAWFQSTAAEATVDSVQKILAVATASDNGLGIVNTAGSCVPPVGNYLIDFTVTGNTPNSMTFFNCLVMKNGVSLYANSATTPQLNTGVAAVVDTATVGGQVFASANGTDVFTLRAATIDSAAAAGTVAGSLRFYSV